jgi:hypothetical protein
MKSKALEAGAVLEMTENRPKRCQLSGHSLFPRARLGTRDRKVYQEVVHDFAASLF